MCLTRILKRWRTAKNRLLIKMSLICMGSSLPDFILAYLSLNRDFSFEALIWKASKTYNGIESCKEAKTIIVVGKWLHSLNKKYLVICFESIQNEVSEF